MQSSWLRGVNLGWQPLHKYVNTLGCWLADAPPPPCPIFNTLPVKPAKAVLINPTYHSPSFSYHSLSSWPHWWKLFWKEQVALNFRQVMIGFAEVFHTAVPVLNLFLLFPPHHLVFKVELFSKIWNLHYSPLQPLSHLISSPCQSSPIYPSFHL